MLSYIFILSMSYMCVHVHATAHVHRTEDSYSYRDKEEECKNTRCSNYLTQNLS